MGAMNRTLSVEQRVNQDIYSGPTSHRPALRTFFRTIPPERVGLNGEYDHSGLAKRVKVKLTEIFGSEVMTDLSITQRGRVVIFTGKVTTPEVLHRLVRAALEVHGANEVETYGVRCLR